MSALEARSGRSKPESGHKQASGGQVRATVSIVKRRLPTPLQCNAGREVNAVYHAGLGIMLPLARSIRWKIKAKVAPGKVALGRGRILVCVVKGDGW